jgi:hypothetical protein
VDKQREYDTVRQQGTVTFPLRWKCVGGRGAFSRLGWHHLHTRGNRLCFVASFVPLLDGFVTLQTYCRDEPASAHGKQKGSSRTLAHDLDKLWDGCAACGKQGACFKNVGTYMSMSMPMAGVLGSSRDWKLPMKVQYARVIVLNVVII